MNIPHFFSKQETLIEAALDYASRGVAVFPMLFASEGDGSKGRKASQCMFGVNAATTNLETVREWWTSFPTAMIGIPTGMTTGLFVIDIDGEVGQKNWEILAAEHGFDPDETLCETSPGGRHYYYIFPVIPEKTPGCTTGVLAVGINTKGEGGSIVISPSVYTPLSGKVREVKKLPPVLLDHVLKYCCVGVEDKPEQTPISLNLPPQPASTPEPQQEPEPVQEKPHVSSFEKRSGGISRIDIISAASTPPAPLDYVLPGLVRQSVGSLICAGGGGKSMLILQCAAAISLGTTAPISLTPLKKGRCLIIPAEDMAQVLSSRLYYLAKYQKYTPKDLKILSYHLTIPDIIGSGLSPNLCPREFDKVEFDWVDAISTLGDGCRLIVLDTLRRFHLLDENNGGDMAQVIGAMEKVALNTGAAVVFLHHTNKGAALNGQSKMQQAARGSSVLTDNIRWQAFLSAMDEEESQKKSVEEGGTPIADDRGYFVKYGISKQNYGPPIQEVWLQREKEGGILFPVELYSTTKRNKNINNGSGI